MCPGLVGICKPGLEFREVINLRKERQCILNCKSNIALYKAFQQSNYRWLNNPGATVILNKSVRVRDNE